MRASLLAVALLGPCMIAGCPDAGFARNPFLTLTEVFGSSALGGDDDDDDGGGDGGGTSDLVFRSDMTLTIANRSAIGDLNVSFAAWVSVSSIRSADQQDALLNAGYVQLTEETKIGSAYTLPPGTFIFNGPGLAGTTRVEIPAGETGAGGGGEGTTVTTDNPLTEVFTFVTPDVLLVYSAPPTSCESVAFEFTQFGLPLEVLPTGGGGDDGDTSVIGGATGIGARKTLGQIDVYDCSPFQPGLFLRSGGGSANANQFLEGDDVRIDFFPAPVSNTGGDDSAAIVTIG